MNNIESIKEDYNIGDPIRIVCSLGIKEGYIVDFKEDRIKIRPFEEGRKPISISEDSIKDFEEALPPSESTSFSPEDSRNQGSSSLNAAKFLTKKETITEAEHNQDSSEKISTNTCQDFENKNLAPEQEESCDDNSQEKPFAESDDKTTTKTEIRVGSIK